MNNLYRKLNLPFNVITPGFPKQCGTFEHLTEVTMFSYPKEGLDSNLTALISGSGLSVYWSEIFYNPPHTSIPIHADTHHISNMAKINIHHGCSGSIIKWYNPLPEFTNKAPLKTPLDTEYLMFEDNEALLIHSQEIDTISVMNAGVPHGFENNTDEPSWILSLVLFKDGMNAHFDDVLNVFQDYLYE